MKDDYSRRQSAKDAQYERDYIAWVDSLPPEERAKLGSQGLDKPMVARHGNGSASGDSADSPLMRIGDDPALVVQPADVEDAVAATPVRDATDILRHFVADLLSEGNTRLTVECLDGGEEFKLDSEAAGHQWRCHIYHLPESPIMSMSFLFFCRVFYLSNPAC